MGSSRKFFVLALASSLAAVACGSASSGQPAHASNPPPTHSISGTITGPVYVGVAVHLTGSAVADTTTDSSGRYAFTGLADGDYTVAPSASGYTFTPPGESVTVAGADVPDRDFASMSNPPPTHSISGTITGPVYVGVAVHLTGSAVADTTTDSSGRYAFTGLADGDYTVAPSASGYTFTPPGESVTVAGADAPDRDFASTSTSPPTHSISGTITGPVYSGVTVWLRGAAWDITTPSTSTRTDAQGHYSFDGLADGQYTLKAPGYSYVFSPSSIPVTVDGADVPGQDFASAAASGISLSGWVDGTTMVGVDIELDGTAVASTTTDAFGGFAFEWVPDGAYTITASSSSWSFTPARYAITTHGSSVTGLHFVSTPPSSPFTVAIAGDVASGVAPASYPGDNVSSPNPDVVTYDPTNDLWTIWMRFDAGNVIGLGGAVSFAGIPSVATYTEATPGLRNTYGGCWSAASVPGGNYDEDWVATSFSLTFSSVGAGVPTNLYGANTHFYVSDYPVHGTFHAVCTPTTNSIAVGTVTVDVAF